MNQTHTTGAFTRLNQWIFRFIATQAYSAYLLLIH